MKNPISSAGTKLPAAFTGLIILLGSAALVWYIAAPKAVELTLSAQDWPHDDRPLLEDIFSQFTQSNPLITVQLTEASGADLAITSREPDEGDVSRVWKLTGWRVFARLEALASYEGSGEGPWILPLEKRELTPVQWLRLKGISTEQVFLAAQDSPEARKAWETYAPLLPADLEPRWYSDPQTLQKDLETRRVLFCLWNEGFYSLLPTSSAASYRGFALPGTRTPGSGVFVGSALRLTYRKDHPNTAALNKLVKYLTSQGVSRPLARTTRKEFLWWEAGEAGQELPEVTGPERIVEE